MQATRKFTLGMIAALLLCHSAMAHPGLVRVMTAAAKPTSAECQVHPTAPNRVHRGLQADSDLRFSLQSGGKPVAKACPGIPYTLKMTSALARECLVTVNKGALAPAPSTGCPNRWYSTNGRSANQTITLSTPCSTSGAVVVTSTCSNGIGRAFMRGSFTVNLLRPTDPTCKAIPKYTCK